MLLLPSYWTAARFNMRAGASLRDVERWALHVVNAEYERSKGGGWRRLFPSARSAEYYPFLDEARTMHRLPFDV